ncbi:MAG: hypothetical protein ACXVKN_00395 [Acidimicrobiia bacterium]
MRSHPSPTESEPTHDELSHDELDTDADSTSSGFIVFSLGASCDEARLDA